MRILAVKKQLLTVLQFFIAVGAYGYMVFKLKADLKYLTVYDGEKAWLIFVALGLMPVNWLLEVRRWQLGLVNVQRISFLRALKVVLMALPYGQLTPARMGEWFGRSSFVHRSGKALIVAIVLSFLQQAVTVCFGMLAVFSLFDLQWKIIFAAAAALVVVLAGLYFALRFYFKRRAETVRRIFSAGQVIKLGLLSIVRYAVFSTQYVIILYGLGAQSSALQLYITVSVIYFAVNLLPLTSIADLGLRSSIAISLIKGNSLGIAAASFLIWLINIGLPVAIGSGLLLSKTVRAKGF